MALASFSTTSSGAFANRLTSSRSNLADVAEPKLLVADYLRRSSPSRPGGRLMRPAHERVERPLDIGTLPLFQLKSQFRPTPQDILGCSGPFVRHEVLQLGLRQSSAKRRGTAWHNAGAA
jgi:hypothetical protein